MKIYNNMAALLTDMGIPQPVQHENFFIFKIEDYFGNKTFSIGPYKHDFFELTFGCGHDVDCKIGDTSFKPLMDSVSFSSPYQLSSWRVNSFDHDSLGYMIFFKQQLINNHLDKIGFYKRYEFFNLNTSPLMILNKEQREIVVNIMQNLLLEFENDQRSGDSILAAYLTILLEKIKQFYVHKKALNGFTSRAEEIAFLFENVVKEKATHKMKIADYASQMNLSAAYLSEAIKCATGKTPLSIIREYIILEAKGLLTQTNKTIAVISTELGFDDTSNFVKYFKKSTGITPHTFRKEPKKLPLLPY